MPEKKPIIFRIAKKRTRSKFYDEELVVDYTLYRNSVKIGKAMVVIPDDITHPWHIATIAIRVEKNRGKGYGTRLMDEIIKDADKSGRNIELAVEGQGYTDEEKKWYADRNVRFYKKFGFYDTGKDGGWDGPLMRRRAKK